MKTPDASTASIATPRTAKTGLTGVLALALLALVFLSIIPNGSADALNESWLAGAIFLIASFVFVRHGPWNSLSSERALLLPVAAFAAYCLVRGLFTIAAIELGLPRTPLLPFAMDPVLSVWSFVKLTAAVCLFCLLFRVLRDRLKLFTWGLLAVGNFFALFGILRYIAQARYSGIFPHFIYSALTPGVGFGTFLNQNHFAFLMLMTIALNAALFWRGAQNRQIRAVLGVLTGLAWVALVLTVSRGGIISAFGVIACIVFFPLARRRRSRRAGAGTERGRIAILKRIALFAAFSVMLVFSVFFIGRERVVTRFENLPLQVEAKLYTTSYRRLDVYKAAASMIGANPVFGVGFGGFGFAVSQYIDISGRIVPAQAHNDYLELVASGGIPGLALAIWFIVVLLRLMLNGYRRSRGRFEPAARVAAMSGLAGVAIHSAFDYGLQYAGNALFVLSLVAIASFTAKREDSRDRETENDPQSDFESPLIAGILIFLAVSSFYLGAARFVSAGQAEGWRTGKLIARVVRIPFDAESLESRAASAANDGNLSEEIRYLEAALRYRPGDHEIWMRLGTAQMSQNAEQEAEASFRRAAALAPGYSEPRFELGKLLLKTGRRDEGYRSLHFAFRRNPFHFYEVARSAWRDSGMDDEKTIRLLSPLIPSETAMLSMFFFDLGSYESVVKITCRNRILIPALRKALVQRLLEKRQFHIAYRVQQKDCRGPRPVSARLENGGFEHRAINDGMGFGWRIGPIPNDLTVALDPKTAAEGKSSLIVLYNGQTDPSLRVISQMFVVEPGTEYTIVFSYKSAELTTGGIPVIQIVQQGVASETDIEEIGLDPDDTDWTQRSVTVTTEKKTEVIDVRLKRRPCAEDPCPVFGRIWLDGFEVFPGNTSLTQSKGQE